MDDSKYIFTEDINQCNICYETFHDCFKCKRRVFLSCPRCFNNHNFLDDDTQCPKCRF